MKFCDKLIQFRREKGYSQEQLADLLNVSRQSVSKWEAGQSMPELNKLIILADLFGTTVDNLVRENAQTDNEAVAAEPVNSGNQQYVIMPRYYGEFEYKSKRTLKGIPLVHIRFGIVPKVAKGIIAIGNISVGFISIGGIAFGGISFGGVSIGLLALAGCAIGALAFGGLAIGILAAGGFAFGVYTIGGMSIASQIAVGGSATANTAIGAKPSGDHVLEVTEAVSGEQIRDFILQYHPRIWRPLLKLFTAIGRIL